MIPVYLAAFLDEMSLLWGQASMTESEERILARKILLSLKDFYGKDGSGDQFAHNLFHEMKMISANEFNYDFYDEIPEVFL